MKSQSGSLVFRHRLLHNIQIQMRRTVGAALRSNGARRQRRTQRRRQRARFTSSSSGSAPLHHGFSSGACPALRRINFGLNTRIMGIHWLCARTRGSILSWWKPCHRSRGPWDRTGRTRWRERTRRFPTTKRYQSRFSAGLFLVLMECFVFYCGYGLFAHWDVRCAHKSVYQCN